MVMKTPHLNAGFYPDWSVTFANCAAEAYIQYHSVSLLHFYKMLIIND